MIIYLNSLMFLGSGRVQLGHGQVPVPVTHSLEIGGAATMKAETCQYLAIYDNQEVTVDNWQILSGGSYATIDSNGLLTALPAASASVVEIGCSYGGLVASKSLDVTYVSGSSAETETETEVVVNPDTGQTTETTTTTTTTTDAEGNVTTETTVSETITNGDGSSSQSETTEVVNPDGSSISNTTTVNYDENGETLGSSENITNVNADGSSRSTTTNYSAEGDPTTAENVAVDTLGNVDTQDIEYNSNGDPVVTSYTIDTTESGGEGKQIVDGVNTEYYAFDVTRGFILDLEFTIDFTGQPAGQDQGHHQILTMKRATPEPWYGFQLRQSNRNKYIQLGTQFSSGSNTNTTISPTMIEGNVATYELRIVYDPTAESNTFVCTNMQTGATVFSSDGVFPDLPELRYLKVTLGYAMDANGDAYRYSNINVHNFSIVKLVPVVPVVAEPEITCDGEAVTLSCRTLGATIYYRLNQTGGYIVYGNPIELTEDTVVEAFAELNGESSEIVSQTCIYNPVHDYSKDYLTFDVVQGGTIQWMCSGSGYNKAIEYSKNGGEWTAITASTTPVAISVDANDKVRFRGTNNRYGGSKTAYAGFEGGSATFNIEGNIMSLISGDNFTSSLALTQTYAFCSLFKKTNVLSAENLVLPATTLTQYCYRAMLANCTYLTTAPKLPATTLAKGCYYYMFDWCTALTAAPDLLAPTLVQECYLGFVHNCASLNYIKCLATDISATDCTKVWVEGVGATGTFVKDENMTSWTTGVNGIPTGWTVTDSGSTPEPEEFGVWKRNGQEVELPYSVNALDGHSSAYYKGTASFSTNINIERLEPTYLQFDHADQSAKVYVNGSLFTEHMGGYNSFTVDITNAIHTGSNNIEVVLDNTTRNTLAPAAGDFNFNATLGKVDVVTGSVLPSIYYGYDGFRITADVTASAATVYVETNIASQSLVECIITDGTQSYSSSKSGSGIVSFTSSINNPHLWDGVNDPHLYNVTVNVYHNGSLSFTATRPYGLRYFEYATNRTITGVSGTYTGFLLNDHPYYLRGVCMHQDLEGKANALTSEDIAHDFEIIQELGCNFIRTAHYPHPREFYDWCDRLGIIVETEVPWVNKAQSTMPTTYYDNLESQIVDMVTQHYNHPSIVFWGLANEIQTDDKDFAKDLIDNYSLLIRSYDSSRLIGYVVSHNFPDGLATFNNPDVDWIGQNMYVGWYQDTNSNNPSSRVSSSLHNAETHGKPMAYSEYGCGGTRLCHSDDFMNTTTRGNHERHDIEYQMWLHEGHIAAIKNYPQLLFTSQWVLFDFAVTNRQEGYIICQDGVNTSVDNNLKRLNDKGLVERDHTTKKDTFYLYKAEWNPTPFVHICGKDYLKNVDRTIKCYTNEPIVSLYVNNEFIESKSVVNHTVTFASGTYHQDDVIRVVGTTPTVADSMSFATVADYSKDYLTFKALEDTTFTFSTNAIQYSVDNGSTWTTLAADTATPTVAAGNKIMFKQTGLVPNQTTGIGTFSSTGRFNAYGNVMSMLFGDNFDEAVSLSGKDYAFAWLFFNCTKLIDATNLILPATTLSYLCYEGMFSGCSNMTKAPAELPAPTVSSMGYSYMFRYCSNLLAAPVIKATEIGSSGCYYMFTNCSVLRKVTCYATTGLTSANLDHWLDSVSATGTFVKVADTTWPSGASGIPSGWAVQTVTV